MIKMVINVGSCMVYTIFTNFFLHIRVGKDLIFRNNYTELYIPGVI